MTSQNLPIASSREPPYGIFVPIYFSLPSSFPSESVSTPTLPESEYFAVSNSCKGEAQVKHVAINTPSLILCVSVKPSSTFRRVRLYEKGRWATVPSRRAIIANKGKYTFRHRIEHLHRHALLDRWIRGSPISGALGGLNFVPSLLLVCRTPNLLIGPRTYP